MTTSTQSAATAALRARSPLVVAGGAAPAAQVRTVAFSPAKQFDAAWSKVAHGAIRGGLTGVAAGAAIGGVVGLVSGGMIAGPFGAAAGGFAGALGMGAKWGLGAAVLGAGLGAILAMR